MNLPVKRALKVGGLKPLKQFFVKAQFISETEQRAIAQQILNRLEQDNVLKHVQLRGAIERVVHPYRVRGPYQIDNRAADALLVRWIQQGIATNPGRKPFYIINRERLIQWMSQP